MESELRAHLLLCAKAFAGARGLELTTVGRMAANDGQFFDRIADTSKAFTARTYDKVVGWFSEHWPEGAEWPPAVPRPTQSEDQSA